MTLKEVQTVIGKKLITARRVIRSNPVHVYFEGTEVKDGRMLSSPYGSGGSVKEAKANYCEKIRGHILVTDAMLSQRNETQLPPKITVK